MARGFKEVHALIESIIQFFARLPLWLQLSWAGWLVIGLAIFIVSVNQTRADSHGTKRNELAGKIVRPTSGEAVPRQFEVEGTVDHLRADQHLWIAVKIGNLYWPKEPEVPANGSEWNVEVMEGGDPPGGQFTLVLLVVEEAGQQTIRRWLEGGNRTGDFPGLERKDIAGMKILESVNVRLR